jgi:hypothetical protein
VTLIGEMGRKFPKETDLMNTDLEKQLTLKSYLLGDLNPDEQLRLEQRLMIDSAACQELLYIEDELIDDYLEGGLSKRDKERFENVFLSAPERKQKLRFAKSLKRYMAENVPKKTLWDSWSNSWSSFWHHQTPALKWALAASLLMLIAGGFWSTTQIWKLQIAVDHEQAATRESRRQLTETKSQNANLTASLESERIRRSQLEHEVASLKRAQKPGHSLLPKQMEPTLLTAILAAGRSRSAGGTQEIKVSPGEDVVKLDLKMEPLEYPRYQAILERIGGDKNWTVISQQAESLVRGQFSGLFVPADLLKRGDYVLKLSGITAAGDIESIGSYYFRAAPK